MKKIFAFLTGRLFIFFALIGLETWFLIAMVYSIDEQLSPVINIIQYFAAVFLVLYIVNKDQDPSYKMAWMIPILALPLLGMMLYFFFSQRKLNKWERKKALEIFKNTSKYARQDKNVYQEIKRQSRDAARQMAYIYNTSLYPAYKNTETEYYPMGEDFFAGLVEALKNAKRYIFLEFFIVKKGYMWDTILDILKQKAAEGVDVRFMYDDIGCMDLLPRYYYKTLNKYGIRCSVFNRLRPVINSMFNNRDHRKIVAIDGHTAFVCGANIGDEYINKKERFGTWKDSGLRLKGDGAWGFTLMFSQLWDYTMNETTDPQTLLPLDEEIEGIESDGYVQPYADNPVDDIRLAENVYLNIISKAERYVFINTPYLILNDNLRLALIAAAESGVDVRITTPHIPDKKVVFLLTRANYKPLLEAGVKIYEYTPGFMHAKSYVCDDQFAVIGTINTDYRSLFLHFECAAFMYGTSSVMALKHDYIKTLDVCTQVTMQDVQRTPWHQKAAQYILKIFAPLI